jgi:hypothetical protein
VGDLHVKPSNLDESEALLGFILDKTLELKVDRLELEGDIADTHDVVRLRVIQFWDKWFKTLSKQKFKTVVLAGNHDMVGDYGSDYSFLHPFISNSNGNLRIVVSPQTDGLYGYLPYIHDDNEFIEAANELANQGARVLVSHPNFIGATYDNGHPINNGVDPDLIDARYLHLIGGHIHTENEYGRVWYIGTPRWFTASCANKSKGIWLCTHDDVTGAMISKEFISTESVCTPILSLTWKEGEDKPTIKPNTKTSLELVGSSEWVSKQKLEMKGLSSLSSKITDIKKSATRKSGKSLHEFLSSHYQTSPDKRKKLLDYMKVQELLE